MGYQPLSLLETYSVIMTSLDGLTKHDPWQGLVPATLAMALSPKFTQDSFFPNPSHSTLGDSLIDWFIDWLIDSSFHTVARKKFFSFGAKNLKIFSNIDLMGGHHISKVGVCTYLCSLTIEEIVATIWYVFWNIHQGLGKILKIMKIFVRVAERNTNTHKYRLFLIFA